MKVLIVNALFHPFTGGVEKHMLELGAHLVKRGVEVHVLTGRLKGTMPEETVEGIRVHRIACREIRLPRIYPPPLIMARGVKRELEALDRVHNFDVIHLQDRWFPDFNEALIYAKRKGKPFVVTLHNARPYGIAPHYTVLGGLYDQFVGKRILNSADKIISVSYWSATDVAKYKIPRDKFVVIHNGIDTTHFKPRKTRAFADKLGVKGPMLLFVGRIIRQKGLDFLVRAMPLVLAKNPDARLVIVGRGNKLEQVKRLVKRLGLETQVIFPGFVSEDELKDALCGCDVFVLPSLWEVLPISILEAMACGRSVVCTNAGGNAELVRDGFNGFVVPKRDPKSLANAINKIVADPILQRRMGENSRKRAVEEFDWPIIAAKTIDAYQKVIAEHAASRPGRKRSLLLLQRRDVGELSEEFDASVSRFRARLKKMVEDVTE